MVSCSENKKANEANENEKSWRWLAAEEDLMPYGVVTGVAQSGSFDWENGKDFVWFVMLGAFESGQQAETCFAGA